MPMSTTEVGDDNAVAGVTVRAASQGADWTAATVLLGHYFDWLAPIAGVPSVPVVQAGAKEELCDIAAVYDRPRTTLHLAAWRGTDVGMIGVKPHGDATAEIVRFFTLPAAREAGAGSALLGSAIAAARRFAYESIVLDTLPEAMSQAVRLYERYGFAATDEPHGLPVVAGRRFRLDL